MATVHIKTEERVLDDVGEISEFLGQFGIWYRRFEGSDDLGNGASAEEVLDAYAEPIEQLKAEGGYVTADVIDITAETPNLQAMLDKFNKEHWHDEDEVRFVVEGRGLFHLHPVGGPVFSIEVGKGDMIKVPQGGSAQVQRIMESDCPTPVNDPGAGGNSKVIVDAIAVKAVLMASPFCARTRK